MQGAGHGRRAREIITRPGARSGSFGTRSLIDSGDRAAGRSVRATRAGPSPSVCSAWRRLFGLERLERLERAPELGHGCAAIAQRRLERPRAVAIADQGEAWARRVL